MEWTNVTTGELIEMYHNSPELWNNKLEIYKDNKLKLDRLTEIASTFHCSIKNVKDKIKNLRTAFHRERKRLAQKKNGSSTSKSKKWMFYNQLIFLSSIDTLRGNTLITRNDETDSDGMESVLLQFAQQQQQQHHKNKQEEQQRQQTDSEIGDDPQSDSQVNGSNDNEIQQERVMKFRSPLRKKFRRNTKVERYNIVKQAIRKDACSTFGEHVANEVRNLGNRTQIIVKQKINTVLYEAAMGYYDSEITHSTLGSSTSCYYSGASCTPSPSPVLHSSTPSNCSGPNCTPTPSPLEIVLSEPVAEEQNCRQ